MADTEDNVVRHRARADPADRSGGRPAEYIRGL